MHDASGKLFLELEQSAGSYFHDQFIELAWSIPAAIAIGLGFLVFVLWKNGKLSKDQLVRELRLDLYRQPTSKTDIWCTILAYFVLLPGETIAKTLVTVLVGIDVSVYLNSVLGAHAPIIHNVTTILIVQVFGMYMLSGFVGWYSHYLAHKVPIFWAFHRPHHSAEALTFFATARGHVGEHVWQIPFAALLSGLLTALLLYVTGTKLQPEVLSILTFIGLVGTPLTYLSHSHIPLSFGRVLNRIYGGPVLHQIHHSAELRHRDKNFGGIYDWIFGTLYLPVPGEQFRLGLNDEELGANNPHKSMKDLYIEPMHYFWRHLLLPWRSVYREDMATSGLKVRSE